MTSPRDPRLQEILASILDRIAEDGGSAVERACRDHPDIAAEIRGHVESLQRFGMLAEPPARCETGVPERLGEFVLRERLGGGGMGVVYRAEQTSLRREVALKIVRPEQLYFAGARERFLREVAIIARLQHPGIVPVYTVGDEGGVPYYAMERVVGCTLADAVDELSSRRPDALAESDLFAAVARRTPAAEGPAAPPPPRRTGSFIDACLRIVAQVAAALDHAHQRGVVHRDVKPSNVMVTPDGRVMVLDFGLASTEEAGRITRSGSQLGSLAYMAPEQVRGATREITARTDVYQLGVTLYELLALRLPYVAEDGEATRRAILAGAPPPLRALNGRVPWDVETVCLTAMERDPARRYASAAAFERDLRNLLERRPIEARRPGPLLRLRRFAQRRPATSVGAALGVLIVVGGPIGYALFERDARRRVEDEQRLTEAQRVRAEAHFRRVLDAVDQLLAPLLADTSEQIPEMERVRRAVLEGALAVYAGFGPEDQSDPALRRDLAHAAVALGDIRSVLHENEAALSDYRRGIAQLDALRAEAGGDDLLALRLVRALLNLGSIETAMLATEEGVASLERAVAVSEALPAEARRSREARYLLARGRSMLGFQRMARNEMEEGERLARAAIADAEALVAEDSDDLEARELLAHTHYELGAPLAIIQRGARRAEALLELTASAAQFRELLLRDPFRRDALHGLAQALVNRSTNHAESELEAAGADLTEAKQIYDQLQNRFPEIGSYRAELSMALSLLGYLRAKQGRLEEAEPLLRRACDLSREVKRAEPDNPARGIHLGVALDRLAGVLRKRGDAAGAVDAWDEALAEAAGAGGHFAMMARPWRWGRAAALVEVGEVDRAAEEADELVAAGVSGFDDLRLAVTVLARCARGVVESDELAGDERERRAASFEDDALDRLGEALDRGFRPKEDWFSDPAIRRLVKREEARERLAAAGVALPEEVAGDR